MTAMAHEPMPTQDDILLEGFLALETPTGFRAELIEGEIAVTPPPDGDHEDYLSLVFEQVMQMSATAMQFSGHKGLVLSHAAGQPADHVIPDATIAPRALRLFRGAPPWMPSDGVAMVVEVTSSKPHKDRVAKRHGYARAGIPLYLLVDRSKATITLFSDPSGDDYVGNNTAPLGKPLPLPAPFSFELETTDFL
ncbi:Uma2 family endonuclease [Streptomyces sp. DSM 41527]|uniref:Uma2 family endonuclease n=1 Tax=Streptomyces mooreae TaxID=3075523 RepID=A0ABU2TEJ2_9ACTN|nr:Uma2 family endonuclease [Streptomyces sp. DSM 41527]MDT0459358.1 Uma2 family endonuclease [Streptomyces sp. DSM 41527]